MALADIQAAFTGGELSPQLYGRVDIAKFQVGAALLRNFYIDYRGGAANRPGTEFVVSAKYSDSEVRLLPFIISETAAYVLEVGNFYIRFIANGVQLESSPGVPYEVATPYAAADIARINYSQSADVMTLVHPKYPPANLSRLTDTTFAYAAISVGPSIDPVTITSMRAPHDGPYNFGYLVTAVDLDRKEESVASNIGVKTSEGLDENNNRVVYLSGSAPAQPHSKFNYYKWGPLDHATIPPGTAWGFIGSAQSNEFCDNNIAPDFSKAPPVWGDPFSGGQIQNIYVTSGGSGYSTITDWPDIPFVPLVFTGDGTDAAGWAIIDPTTNDVIGAYLTNPGKNYTSVAVTAVGAGGTGATFDTLLASPDPNYPACAAYVQQRRVFGGFANLPETLVMSQIGLYNNFNTTPSALDTDSITVSLASQEVNTIKSLVPVNYGLIAFTIGGSFLINGGGAAVGAPITPANVSATPQAQPGANDLRPIVVNYDILYGQAKGNRIRNLSFAWQRQSYTSSDITYLAPHLFDTYTTVDWAWAEEPNKLLWLVRSDGTLLTCTYVPEQEVFAWARHDSQGYFRSVCSVPEGNENAVYVLVDRYLPGDGGCGGHHTYIERLHSRTNCCIYDSWFLDSALENTKLTSTEGLHFAAATGDTIMTICCECCGG